MTPEPPWDRLPFAADPQDWRGYCEQANAADTLALLRGEPTPAPFVWLELAAVEAFGRDAGVAHAAAWAALGAGVLRWLRAGAELDEGLGYADVRFRGAMGLRLCVGLLGGCVLVHLPRGETGGQS